MPISCSHSTTVPAPKASSAWPYWLFSPHNIVELQDEQELALRQIDPAIVCPRGSSNEETGQR